MSAVNRPLASIWILCLCVIAIGGCSYGPSLLKHADLAGQATETVIDVKAPLPPPRPGKALVFVMRPKKEFLTSTFDIFMDGEIFGGIGSKAYTYTYVQAGRHKMQVHTHQYETDKFTFDIDLKVEAKQTYYYVITLKYITEQRFYNRDILGLGPVYINHYGIDQVSQGVGARHLRLIRSG